MDIKWLEWRSVWNDEDIGRCSSRELHVFTSLQCCPTYISNAYIRRFPRVVEEFHLVLVRA